MYDPDEECEKLTKRIEQLCIIKGMSISGLAKKAEIAPSTLNELIHKKTKPQVYTLFRICNALEVRIEDLFIEYKKENLTGEEQSRLYLYQHLPEWKKKMIDEYLEMVRQYKINDKCSKKR